MPFCVTCGSEVQGRFCVKCGSPVLGAAASEASPRPAPAASAPPVAHPGAMPPAARKKTSPLVWILVAVVALFVLIGVAIVGAGFFVVHKARQAGLDPGLMEKNPGLAMTKLLAAVNPDVEVLGVDEGRGVITLKDKKTGETVTVSFEDVKQGRISFRGNKGETVTFGATGEGNNSAISVNTSEGSFVMGGGARFPAWIPVYPGAQVQGRFREQKAEEESGAFGYTADKPVNEVVRFYTEGLKSAGLEVSGQPEEGTVSGSDQSKGREITVHVTAQGAGSSVAITYSGKP